MKTYPLLEQNKFHISVADSPDVSLHGHGFLEFSYIAAGQMEHIIAGQRTHVQAGQFFIVDYGTRHSYRAVGEEPLRVINFLFYPEFIDRTLAGMKSFDHVVNSYLIRFRYSSLSDSPTGKTFSDADGKIYRLVQQIMLEYDEKKYGYIECIRTMFAQILIYTCRKIAKDNPPDESAVIREIKEYVCRHYAEKIRLSQLAVRYSYSLSHLSKKFKEETGLTFCAYLQKVRVEQSLRLLDKGGKSVEEIAAAVGYDNVKFFGKVFKETLHLTPRRYKSLRQGHSA